MITELMDKKVSFCEATPLIDFIRANTKLFCRERINGIYTPGVILWEYRDSGERVFEAAENVIIIEFDNFVIKIDYHIASEIDIYIITREDFYRGKLTGFHILGHKDIICNPLPFDRNEYLECVNTPVKEIIIERFSHEFESIFSNETVRPDGGDYFDSIVFMTEENGLRLTPADAIHDGGLYYDVIDAKKINEIQDNNQYERIKVI